MRSFRPAAIIAGLVIMLAFLGSSPAANAQPYTGTPSITLSQTSVEEGSTVTIVATCLNFMPNSQVTVILHTASGDIVLGTGPVDANGNGTAERDFQLPPGTTVGPHDISCVGPGQDGTSQTVTAELVVTPLGTSTTTTGTSTTGTLPRTGSDSTNLLRIGIVLIVAGAALAIAFRRRSNDSAKA